MTTPATTSAPPRPSGWWAGLTIVFVTVLAVYALPMYDLVRDYWLDKADYSFGFLVPVFCAWWIWSRWEKAPQVRRWPRWEGLPFFALSAGFLWLGTFNYARALVHGIGLACAMTGIVLMFFGGWRGLKWAWPALLFLFFMFPMPDRIESSVAWQLRRIAVVVSEACLQTIGYPVIVEGTVLVVGDQRLDVENACSGLGMLLAFCALCAASAMTVQRPLSDKLIILLSAIPIAVLSNVIRITVTCIVFANGWTELGKVVVHDLAGWLMMPLALGLIWLELKLLDWILPINARKKNYDFIKQNYLTAQGEMPIILGKRRHSRAKPDGATETASQGPLPYSIPLPGDGPPASPTGSDRAIPLPGGKPTGGKSGPSPGGDSAQ